MKVRKLDVMIARFPYGGNGGTQSECPDVGDWLASTVVQAKGDQRINRVFTRRFVDTPITMTRNQAVRVAKDEGADVLLMVDSDQAPDVHLTGDPLARPFWDTSFDFLYNHYEKGPCVVGAPYCGPPPQLGHGAENIYVFLWETKETAERPCYALQQYSRSHAASMSGILPAAALPTGLIMFDTRVFDLVKPPYFYYEYEKDGEPCDKCGHISPGPQEFKASTEDVTATRDISLAGVSALGYNPVYVNWDSWAGHWKPKLVTKPYDMTVDQIGEKLQEAIVEGRRSNERMVWVGEPEWDTATIMKEHADSIQTERLSQMGITRNGAPGANGCGQPSSSQENTSVNTAGQEPLSEVESSPGSEA